MKRITVNVDDELKEVLERRATFLRRSTSAEIVTLIETALAQEDETNRAILQAHYAIGSTKASA
ncbi:hypothetical protein [Mesorhizobium sp. M7A.F.Ca.MR.362.00.0.0]|uniref:hypothetical protein n=1 Tax=Mesorhizobium sp. M7A.F.Ca.MR.362.00.0.0 TaxID=2496779 RepID=UPI000FD52897|nr:hypothetical protein [Mesorhizobium sp. M7A.F.Ca.MR.362.00.0.0]RUU78134.1 hypothetical protein EOC06_20990 [Mesorhizobium sp. M7A.F.Ca.MR.362.00.0.0]RWN95448.1 MAG: hypothetical protein EOS05_11685 [Mesorhizobium sp.]